MLRKSSKWELGFVHYIVKFTISRFVISRFECTEVSCGLACDAEKKVNCILGSRQTDDDLKTLFALDPGETKQRLMRL